MRIACCGNGHRRGSQEALEKLILYNLTDVVNMVRLMEIAFGLKIPTLTFPGSLPPLESLMVPELGQSVTEAWISRLLDDTIAKGCPDA